MQADPHIDDERFKTLLERWMEGDFTRTEEQALKTLTDSDDFRREAMEGYATVPEADHAERLQRMRAKLREDEGESSGGGKLFALPRLLAAAAVLVLLVAAFWFFPTINAPKDTAAFAQREAPVPTQMPEGSQPSPTRPETKTPETASNNFPVAKSAPKLDGAPLAGASSVAGRAEEMEALQQNTETKDDAPAEITVEEISALADAKVEKQTPDLASAKPNAPAGPPRDAPQPAATKEYVLLKDEAKKSKAKVPTKKDSTWHDTERRSKVDSLRQQVRRESERPPYSEPIDGWEDFSDYLRQFARLTPDARNHNISGSVRLQFIVGEDGTPFNFVVVKGLGYGCDEEAIRLVKAWEWVRGKNPLTTVEVPFVR